MFLQDQFFTVVGDPVEMYESLKKYLQSQLDPVLMEHVAWVTDESILREEMLDSYNSKCNLSEEEIQKVDLKNWKPLLSQEEWNNYPGYLQKYYMNHLDPKIRPIRGMCVSQDPKFCCMAGSSETLPTFTKDSTRRVMMSNLDRWLTAYEKLAISGFPIHQDFCSCAGFGCASEFLLFGWKEGPYGIYG